MTDADLNKGALEATPSWLKPASTPSPIPTVNTKAPTSPVVTEQSNIAAQNAANTKNVAETNANFNYPTTPVATPKTPRTLSTTEKEGLNNAYARQQSGTANADDIKNIKYAQDNKLWTAPATTTDTTKTTETINADGTKKVTTVDGKTVNVDSTGKIIKTPAELMQEQIDAQNVKTEANYTAMTNALTNFMNGTVKLTANQQAQIDNVNNLLAQSKLAQQNANKNYEGSISDAGLSSGRSRYAPEIQQGIVQSAITSGLAAIQKLDSDAINQKATLEQGFQESNFNKIMTSYQALDKINQQKQAQLDKIQETAYTHATDIKNAEYKATQDALNQKITLIDKGYEPITDITGLKPEDYIKIGDEYFKKPDYATSATSDIKDYEYAKKNGGFTGTFMEYLTQKANMKTPANTVTDSEILSYAKYLQTQDYTLTDQDALNQAKIILGGQQTNKGGSTTSNTSGVPGGSTGKTVSSNGVTFDIGTYATDPNHENAVASILGKIGTMKSVDDINAYIQKVAPGSPVTGDMIAAASSKYNIPWEIQMAMMQQDSNFGTAGKGARTFNPGNVGNTDSGAEVNYKNWQAGVDALANNLSKRVVTDNQKTTTNYNDVLKKNQNTILASIPVTERSQFMQGLIKSASSGDKAQVKDAIYNGLVENSKDGKILSEDKNKADVLTTLKTAFEDYYNAGGDSNIIKGKFGDVLNALGTSRGNKEQELLGKLTQIKQGYRNAITGAAWGVQEDTEYNNLLGSLSGTKAKNLGSLKGAVESANTTVNKRIENAVGKEVFNTFFKEPKIIKDKSEVSSLKVGDQFTYNGKTYEMIGTNSFNEIK